MVSKDRVNIDDDGHVIAKKSSVELFFIYFFRNKFMRVDIVKNIQHDSVKI